MTDRLVKLLEDTLHEWECDVQPETLSQIAEHLIENGVVVPPCKVGDTVYKVEYCRCGNPECYEMKHCYKKDTKKTPEVYGKIMLRQDGKRLSENSHWNKKPKWEWRPIGTICYKIIQKPFKLEWLTEIGKTVFLTKEEAEAKLKEREGE